MAKNDSLDGEDKVRMLRAVAFQVHRKQPIVDVLMEHVENELRGSRRRIYRPAAEHLGNGDALAALQVLGVVGDEAACILGPVIDDGDHRLLSNTLNRLADWIEGGGS